MARRTQERSGVGGSAVYRGQLAAERACRCVSVSLRGLRQPLQQPRDRRIPYDAATSCRHLRFGCLTGSLLVQQHVNGMLHGTGQRDLAGIYEEDLVDIVDGVQAVSDNYPSSGGR
jgi:hypothetical protein